MEFINNGGLESPNHQNTAPWENNPNPTQPVPVDSYGFFSGTLYGYVAFFRGPKGKWVIKSFKKNDRPDPRFLQFQKALSKAGLIK
jgi:hypothetical protein